MKDGLQLSGRVPINWGTIRNTAAVVIAITGGSAGMLSMTRPDSAVADSEKIAAAAKSATEAQAVAAAAQDKAEQARRDIDALAATVAAQTRALDKTNDKLDAQSAQLNQIIGQLKGLK